MQKMITGGWGGGPSPFIFDGPLPADEVVGRDDEVHSLRDWMAVGRFVRMEAPRKYGKTSVLNRLAADLEAYDGTPLVLVDLYGVLSLHDLMLRVGAAYDHHARGRFRRAVDGALRSGVGFGLTVLGTGGSVQMAQRLREDPLPVLHQLLDLPARIADRSESGRVVVAFDEFQEIRNVPNAEGILRSHIQHHRAVASYLFAGSSRGMLSLIFADRASPLFGQAEAKQLGPLDAGVLGAHIEQRFAVTGRSAGTALDALLETARGHPQRSMLLAHQLWLATSPGTAAGGEEWVAALDAARRVADREAVATWNGLTANERRVLRSIAEFGSAFRREGQQQYDLKRGSVGRALQQLVDKAEIDHAGGEPRFVDPLFEQWVGEMARSPTPARGSPGGE